MQALTAQAEQASSRRSIAMGQVESRVDVLPLDAANGVPHELTQRGLAERAQQDVSPLRPGT